MDSAWSANGYSLIQFEEYRWFFFFFFVKESGELVVDHGTRVWWSVASRVENDYHQSVPGERWCVQREDHVIRDRQQDHPRGRESDRIRMQRDFHAADLPCLRLGPTFQVSILLTFVERISSYIQILSQSELIIRNHEASSRIDSGVIRAWKLMFKKRIGFNLRHYLN